MPQEKKSRKSDALDEIKQDLDRRHQLARELLDCINKAQAAYAKDKHGTNLPRCSREHVDWLAKDLKQYVDDTHTARCNLPRLLSNEPESGD